MADSSSVTGTNERRVFGVADSVRLVSVHDPQISPDGAQIAFSMGDGFVKSGPDHPRLPASNLWSVPVSGGEPRRLTAGGRSDAVPRWSPDGESIAFLSDRESDGQRQIYLLPTAGGEARQITFVDGSIPSLRSLDSLKWLPDGSGLAFIKIDPETEPERELREAGIDAAPFEGNPKYTRLWKVGADGSSPICISPAGLQIWEYSIAPDSKRVAAVVSDTPWEWDWYRCRLVTFASSGDEMTALVNTDRQLAKPVWSPNGECIAYLTSNWSDRGSDSGDVMLVQSGGGDPRNLTVGAAASYDSLCWSADSSSIIATANVDGGSAVVRINVDTGATEQLWAGESWLLQLSTSADSRFAALVSAPETHTEIYSGTLSGDTLPLKPITNLHPELPRMDLGKTERIHWSAADGREIGGYVALPPPGSAGNIGGPYPTIALIHGGPASAVRAGVDPRRWAHLLSAAGFAVYMPNYRGSTGRGVEFTESNIGDMGGADFEDMMAGLDYLVDLEIADPERQGIAGWSYGGFISAWAVTQTNRFGAAVMGTGISDWRSFHGRSYLHTWDVIHYGGSDPYDPEGAQARFSPINYIASAKTPTLILHGEEDWDVPVEQSYQFHRALKDFGVETQLVVYPREPHGPVEYEHQIDIGTRLIDWFTTRLA